MQEIIIAVFIVLMLAGGYYSFIVLPRQRAFRKHFKEVSAMGIGDEVVTFGGIVGKITRIDADKGLVSVEVAQGIELRMVAMAIHRKYDPEDLADSSRQAIR